MLYYENYWLIYFLYVLHNYFQNFLNYIRRVFNMPSLYFLHSKTLVENPVKLIEVFACFHCSSSSSTCCCCYLPARARLNKSFDAYKTSIGLRTFVSVLVSKRFMKFLGHIFIFIWVEKPFWEMLFSVCCQAKSFHF